MGIPGNIPNPAVKRVSADGTWRAASWESKKLPTSLFLFKTEDISYKRRCAVLKYGLCFVVGNPSSDAILNRNT